MKEYYGRNIQFTSYLDKLNFNKKSITYIIYGHEICPSTGSKHLQGFCILKNNKLSRKGIQKVLGDPKCHIEKMYSTITNNTIYCKKDNNYIEYGIKPLSKYEKYKMKINKIIEKIYDDDEIEKLNNNMDKFQIISGYYPLIKGEHIFYEFIMKPRYIKYYEDEASCYDNENIIKHILKYYI